MLCAEDKDERWFEDYAAGDVYELGPVVMDEAEILDFGRRYDPQPFHTDPAIGTASPFGGLTASGWHVCAVMTRMLVDGLISPRASLGSPGMEQIRWLKPVRPGDVLRCQLTITSARLSQSRPGCGIIAMDITMLNQHGDAVMTCSGAAMYRTRP
ncbi:MAG: MaoC family dehydratase [Rhodomicrobium sp.]